uniref:40S ribosomal protein S15 n=1 Tax=Balaenoptera musculus TaxID=9771 RepID=A0A8C0C6Z1_BALMU
MAEMEQKQQTFCNFTYSSVDLVGHVLQAAGTAVQHPATAEPGLPRKQHTLLKRQCKAKKEALPKETPEVVKMHLQDIIILPEMVASMVGVYKVKTFNQVESSLSSQSPTQPGGRGSLVGELRSRKPRSTAKKIK